MSTASLARSEQEVHLSMSADEPHTWYVYTDYPKWQRRFEKMGAPLVRVMSDGIGREYTLRVDQLFFRKDKRRLSEAERVRRSDHMRELRATE